MHPQRAVRRVLKTPRAPIRGRLPLPFSSGRRIRSPDDISAASHYDLAAQLATSTRILGAAGAVLVQFCYMARASTVGGATEPVPQGFREC